MKHAILIVFIAIAITGCISMRSSGVLPLGGDAFTVTVESESNKIEAKATALREAASYCVSNGKELSVENIKEGSGTGIWADTDTYTVDFLCQ